MLVEPALPFQFRYHPQGGRFLREWWWSEVCDRYDRLIVRTEQAPCCYSIWYIAPQMVKGKLWWNRNHQFRCKFLPGTLSCTNFRCVHTTGMVYWRSMDKCFADSRACMRLAKYFLMLLKIHKDHLRWSAWLILSRLFGAERSVEDWPFFYLFIVHFLKVLLSNRFPDVVKPAWPPRRQSWMISLDPCSIITKLVAFYLWLCFSNHHK